MIAVTPAVAQLRDRQGELFDALQAALTQRDATARLVASALLADITADVTPGVCRYGELLEIVSQLRGQFAETTAELEACA